VIQVLVLTSRLIESRYSGYDLRVANLCAHIPGTLHLVIAPLGPKTPGKPTLSTAGLFNSVEELAPLLEGQREPWRHLRLTDDSFLKRSSPRRFGAARDRLHAVMRQRRITHVVVFGGNLAELADTLRHPRVILDVCDSVSLTARREIEWSAERPPVSLRWKRRLDLHRSKATEASLPHRFSQVTTVSPPDTREIERLAGGASNVVTVPNGVDDAFLGPLPEPGRHRAVAFWGNQAFGPNLEALRFFVTEVYHPVLRPAGVEVCIFGPNAPRWLNVLAAEDAGILLPGYIPDLRAGVKHYPVMVNPMRTGSGLKNKVLEAFGLGLVVVSTPLGMEALPTAQDGVHFIAAPDGPTFASAILSLLEDEPRRLAIRSAAKALLHGHYRWDIVGSTWRSLFEGDGSNGSRASDTT